MRRYKILGSLLLILAFIYLCIPNLQKHVYANEHPSRVFYHMSGSYQETLSDIIPDVLTKFDKDKIAVLAISFDFPVQENELIDICSDAAGNSITCELSLLKLTEREDANESSITDLFSPPPDLILLLGDNQVKMVQIAQGTLLYERLLNAYEEGVTLLSIGATINALNYTMIAGLSPGYEELSLLNFGAVQIWNSDDQHGLGLLGDNQVIDNNIFFDNNITRLINSISRPGTPNLGIGADARSGFSLVDNTIIQDIFGQYSVLIFDAGTYHAAESVKYVGPFHKLSLRNIIVHLLAPGEGYYDLSTREYSLANIAPRIERSSSRIEIPSEAGPLFLVGRLDFALERNDLVTHFINLCGGKKANILVVSIGFPTDRSASAAVEKFSEQLEAIVDLESQSAIVSRFSSNPVEVPENTSGIILLGRDQSLISPRQLENIKSSWLSGIPVFADDAAVAALGAFYSAHSPTPQDMLGKESAIQASLKTGRTRIQQGLGFININIEPRINQDNRWGRLFSLAFQYPDLLSIGIDVNTGLLITDEYAQIIGDGEVYILDFRSATLEIGENENFAIANGLLDVFVPGEIFVLKNADVLDAPVLAATPVLPTATFTTSPTLSPTPTQIPSYTPTPIPPTKTTQNKMATPTLRPTPTPLAVPPPTDPNLLTAMIVVGVFSVIIVFIGVWINRRQFQ